MLFDTDTEGTRMIPGTILPLTEWEQSFLDQGEQARKLERGRQDDLEGLDIAVPMLELLIRLETAEEGTLRMTSVAQLLGITDGGATRLVDKAHAVGYLVRKPVEGDRRGTSIAITQQGRLIRAKARARFDH